MNIYQFKLVCRCPYDDMVNIYDVKIESDEQVDVEKFVDFQKEIYDKRYLSWSDSIHYDTTNCN